YAIARLAIAALFHIFFLQDKAQVIKNRLHPIIQLLIFGAGQVADIFSQGNDRSCDQQLLITWMPPNDLLERTSQGQQRLSCSRLSDKGHQLDVIIEQKVKGKTLFNV